MPRMADALQKRQEIGTVLRKVGTNTERKAKSTTKIAKTMVFWE